MTYEDLIDRVVTAVGSDGSGDIGIIVRQALRDDPHVTVAEIVAIVRQARTEWAAERRHAAE